MFYYLLALSCGECNVVSLYFALLMDLFLLCVCEFLIKQFSICLGVVVILFLNVMFSAGGGALLDRTCIAFQRICVLCL